MAQSESQPPEFEEDDASKLKNDAASIEGSSDEDMDLLQNDIDGVLDSIDQGDSEWETVDEQSFGEGSDESSVEKGAEPAAQSESDDLLMRAGSILNGGETEIPDIEPEKETESASVEDEDLQNAMHMPDPQTLVESESVGETVEPLTELEEDAGLAAMPDPQTMMAEADAPSTNSDSEEQNHSKEDPVSGTAPPPPAPVALEEDEIKRELAVAEEGVTEDFDAEEAVEDSLSASLPPEVSADTQKEESGSDLSEAKPKHSNKEEASDLDSDAEITDEFEVDDGESFLMDDEDDDFGFPSDPEKSEAEPGQSASSPSRTGADELLAPTHSEKPSGNPSGIRRLAHSLGTWPVAASIALLGAVIALASFKDEMIEWLLNGDVQGSSISRSVAAITENIIEELGPESPYRMAWIESDVKRVSDSEIRIYAQVGVALKADLYQPVEDTVVYAKLPFEPETLAETAEMLKEIGRGDIDFPQKGWSRLYKKSASKGEVIPFNLSYRLLSTEESSDWTLSALRLKEGEKTFAWNKGRPKAHFGKRAYDVSSSDFVSLFRAYERAGMAYLNRAAVAKDDYLAEVAEKARKLERDRKDLLMALSQGSYYKGMVIVGDSGEEAREVSLIITETRNDGQLIKGVLKLEEDGMPGKHFTGFFDLIESDDAVRGQLDLTTIAFAGQTMDREVSSFFSPGTVTKIELQTDGFRMEGDAKDISLRLTRSL